MSQLHSERKFVNQIYNAKKDHSKILEGNIPPDNIVLITEEKKNSFKIFHKASLPFYPDHAEDRNRKIFVARLFRVLQK